jgi:hypothetical protein
MAYTTINKSTDYFNTVLYTGNNTAIGSGGNAITGVGFQPDWVWIKRRASDAAHHAIYDAVRGTTKQLSSSQADAQTTQSEGLTTLGTDGFTIGNLGRVNEAGGDTYVSWNWKAGTGQGSSNTDGSINTTYTSVNTTSGFSISSYTGNGVAGATVGHGLGVAPKMIIIKSTTHAESWQVGHQDMNTSNPWDYYLNLDSTNAKVQQTNRFNNTAPTSSVFSLGSGDETNSSSKSYVAYCFAEKIGYSKFGSYTGNGNANGPFTYTGFKPTWLMIKNTGANGSSWVMHDNKRDPDNICENNLDAENNTTEANTQRLDILSNGFKQRSTLGFSNSDGVNYIYMAFGQSLVGSNNIPATAR